MKFKILHSSSKGNLYTVTAKNGDRILLECGVPFQKLIESMDFNFDNVLGCFVTHGHQDHCKSTEDLIGRGINIYSSDGTFEKIGISGHRRTRIINPNQSVKLGAFQVFAFKSIHDVKQPLMFIIKCDNEWLFFTVDTGYIPYTFKQAFKYICIECSFDKDIMMANVDQKIIHGSLARRIRATHLDKNLTIEYIMNQCDLSKCEKIYLLHGSGTNIIKEDARIEVEQKTGITTTWK